MNNRYIQMAIASIKDALEKDGKAQMAETKAQWHPNFAGEWADSIEDWLHDDEARSNPAAAALAEGRVTALRFLQNENKRPYCGTEKEWSWFDKSKTIDDMGDGQSDLEPHLYALLTGTVKTGYKVYPSGFDAINDFVEVLAQRLAGGLPWPDAAEVSSKAPPPDDETDDDEE